MWSQFPNYIILQLEDKRGKKIKLSGNRAGSSLQRQVIVILELIKMNFTYMMIRSETDPEHTVQQ